MRQGIDDIFVGLSWPSNENVSRAGMISICKATLRGRKGLAGLLAKFQKDKAQNSIFQFNPGFQHGPGDGQRDAVLYV
jgi:hypothetical protein